MNAYGNPYGSQSPPAGNMNNAPNGNMMGGFNTNQFTGFINDPTAQMGMQMGQHAVAAGQKYIDQSLNRYISVPALKHYFNVSNSYVVRKLLLVLFPFMHRPWTRTTARGGDPSGNQMNSATPQSYSPPRDDINSPDMYIPIMAFITYILLSTVLAGIRGSFNPALFGETTSTALGVVLFEIVVLKMAMYLLSINNDSQLLDLVAYSGYKFVGVIVTLVLAEVITGGQGTNNMFGWIFFLYTYGANAFFLVSLSQLAPAFYPPTPNASHLANTH
jgi:protein transport protein YIF1